jgi:hypothetical protein
LAKNPRTIYGAVEFSYRDLMATVRCIKTYVADLAAKMEIGALLIHIHWATWSSNWMAVPAHRQAKMVDLLDHGSLLNCKDPRDHIYALLGHPLARTIGTVFLDYTKETLKVFKETTVLLLGDAGVRVLSSAEHDISTIEQDFPTWVIRWNNTGTLNNIYRHPETRYRSRYARSGFPLEITPQLDEDCLPKVFLRQNGAYNNHGTHCVSGGLRYSKRVFDSAHGKFGSDTLL